MPLPAVIAAIACEEPELSLIVITSADAEAGTGPAAAELLSTRLALELRCFLFRPSFEELDDPRKRASSSSCFRGFMEIVGCRYIFLSISCASCWTDVSGDGRR